MKKDEIVATVAIIAFLIFMLINAMELRSVRRFGEMGSGFWPILTLTLAVVLGIILLDNVSALVTEGVWLSGMSYRDNRAVVDGYAFTNMDIVSFVENLKKSGAVTDVYLDESKEAEIEKVAVYKFKLNFRVRV